MDAPRKNLSEKTIDDYIKYFMDSCKVAEDELEMNLHELPDSNINLIPKATGSNLSKEFAVDIVEMYHDYIEELVADGHNEFSRALPIFTNYKEFIGDLIGHLMYSENHLLTIDMKQNYMMPPLDLLAKSPARKIIDISVVEDMRQRIIDGFKKNKVEVRGLSVIAGPTVVRFELTPNQSYKIKQIRSCENTLNEVLSEYGPIRLIASGPAKGIVAVEVPRPDRQIVRLREVLESDEFQKSKVKLPIALGISSENKPIVADLARMLHLLVAGMTGQGKSVLLNNIILSLLYKKSPEDLKLTLIDTKMVEFSQYDQIARQYFIDFTDIVQKVITDAHEALTVLYAISFEMDERYNLFKCAQCRGLEEYNRLSQDGKLSEQDGHHHLPYIVVCIDEFADLILSMGKDAESIFVRIAAKARAVGIHVIIATQRPETNVITGGIKINFPERIALRVKQMNDSSTILDRSVAERLIGRGEMLYRSYYSSLARIQCSFVETGEIKNVCDWIKTNCEPPQPFQLPITPIIEQKTMMEDRDPLFEEAARYIIECGMASTSKLQRRFSVGYYHANRILDQLEAEGIVGSPNGVKPREVLKKKDSNDKHESPKSLFKRLLNLLDSEDDDDSEDDQPKTTMNQIVTDKERDKNDTTRCEDFITEFLKGPEPYKFPYEDYKIIGDTAEIDKVIGTCGIINIGIDDITSTLSTDTMNYVTVGIGENICNAIEQLVENLPTPVTDVAKMLFQILIPKDNKSDLLEIKLMTDFIRDLPSDIDICWGIACDESLAESIKIILIA